MELLVKVADVDANEYVDVDDDVILDEDMLEEVLLIQIDLKSGYLTHAEVNQLDHLGDKRENF